MTHRTVDVSIISAGHNIADARIHRIANALVRENLKVEILCLGRLEDAPEGVVFRKIGSKRGLVRRAFRDLSLPLRAGGKVVMTVAPDTLLCASVIAGWRRQYLVADIYEDYLKLLNDRPWAKGLKGRIAIAIATRANAVAAECDVTSVADVQVPPFQAKRRIVLRNYPDMSVMTQSGARDEVPRAIYIGDVRTSRGLKTILSLAERAPHWHFDIVGSVAPGDEAYVTKWRSTSSAAGRVRFHGRLSPSHAWKYAAGAWVGLALLKPTPAFLEAIPSKLYEYMACGLAVVSTPLPRPHELIRTAGVGFVSSDPQAIAEEFEIWEKDPSELDAMRARAREWALEHLDSAAEHRAFAMEIRQLIDGKASR